jgi:hypothetical protein
MIGEGLPVLKTKKSRWSSRGKSAAALRSSAHRTSGLDW